MTMTDQAQTRRIDDLGRVAIPKPWRQHLGINEGDELCLSLSGAAISVSRSDASEQVLMDKARYEALERLYKAFKVVGTAPARDIEKAHDELYEARRCLAQMEAMDGAVRATGIPLP